MSLSVISPSEEEMVFAKVSTLTVSKTMLSPLYARLHAHALKVLAYRARITTASSHAASHAMLQLLLFLFAHAFEICFLEKRTASFARELSKPFLIIAVRAR